MAQIMHKNADKMLLCSTCAVQFVGDDFSTVDHEIRFG